MQRRSSGALAFIAGMGIVLTCGPAHAFITRLTPLSESLANFSFIVLAKVDKVYSDKPALVLSVASHLKGKLPFARLPINLKGDVDGKKKDHTAMLRKRLAEKMPLILFVDQRELDNKRMKYTVLGFTNGTWFQVIGREVEDKRVSWAFTHCEPYMRRTFAGTTAELRQIIVDALAGRKKPPAPNDKEKPGLGPEIEANKRKDKGARRQEDTGRLYGLGSPRHPVILAPCPRGPSDIQFGVIPTLGIGGPLAILALLFPGLFGGALLVLRNWAALLTVAGVNSTLLCISVWFPRLLRDTWLETGQGLWFTMLVITLAGTMWAWRSHSRQLGAGGVTGPTRSEHVILWVSSVAFLGAFLLIYFLGELGADDPSWKLLVVLTIGFWAAALCLLFRYVLQRGQASSRPGMPAHAIVLWGMVFASTGFAASWPGQTLATVASVSATKEGVAEVAWQVVFPKGGFVVSPPLVHGDQVYVAAAHKQGGADTFGTLYCLNAVTGEEIWHFDNDGEMFQVFSAPTIVDGRLFIGEGFHENKGCRMYCLDAMAGTKIWEFPTESHTESSPCVAGGKVYFGAGDDGLYCVDALTGKKIWQYPGESGDTVPTTMPKDAKGHASKKSLKLHVDASPLVTGGRLYAGSGVDRDGPGCAPAVFCLDAKTGKKIWLMPLLDDNLPVWGSPVAEGGQVFFGSGNGDMMSDATNPTGALLCVDAKTGRELWRFPVDNGILRKPALDPHRVYFGSRNGLCYSVNRKDGKLRWKTKVGGAVLASPVLFHCRHCGTNRLYVLGSQGRARCLIPETGLSLWDMDLGEGTFLASTPCIAGIHTSLGDRRRIYFGAGFGNGAKAALVCVEEK